MSDSDRMEDLVEDIEEAVDDLKELVGGEGVEEEVEEDGLGPLDFNDPKDVAKFYEFKKRVK